MTIPHDFQDDIDAIARIPAVPTILDIICRTTGMGFSAVARVTENRWVCCSADDRIAFGLTPGGELEVQTTICNEIRDHGRAVAIDHVAQSAQWRDHHTPARYGFQSYISLPITLPDGRFFGTLCAIDPRPARVEAPDVMSLLTLFAQLIAHELDSDARLRAMEQQNDAIKHLFRGGLGHDMKNTLMAMMACTRLLAKTPLNDRGQMILTEMEKTTDRLNRQINEAMHPLN